MEPTLACIGGTGAYDLLRKGAFVGARMGPRATPFGPSQPIYRCESRFGSFYFLSRHGESSYELAPSFVNYRANIYALKDLGVRSIVTWSETRAVSHNYRIGQYVLVNDLVDETYGRPHTFFENQGVGLVRQWPVFCPTIHKALITSLTEEGCTCADKAVYVCIEGPRLETPAEARKYASFGGELIGTTLAPEVFLAKELQMCYASICYVAAYAETGSEFRPFEHGRVLDPKVQTRRAVEAMERLPRIIDRLSDVLYRTNCECPCEKSMHHHIAGGQIGLDWRGWFNGGGKNGAGALAARADVAHGAGRR